MIALVLSAAIGTGAAVGIVAFSPPNRSVPEVPVVQEYAYGPKKRHQLDAYLPAGHASRAPATGAPVLVLVHGGAWTDGDKASMARLARVTARSGTVAVAVNYGLAPRQSWGTQRADLRRAVTWVRTQAGQLKVDPEQIFVLGSSAGGEVALSALTKGAGAELVRGVATLSAPTDLALVAADTTRTRMSGVLAASLTDDLLKCGENCAELFARRSVANQLDRRDPALLLFASRAEYVDPASTMRLHATAIARQVDSSIVLLEGKRHGMSYSMDALPTVLRWMQQRAART